MRFGPPLVASLIGKRDKLNYLVIPMSFYREGVRDYDVHRYVSAFFNFYFFLEGLYGGGKTKNPQVLMAFRSSAQFRAAVQEAHANLDEARMAPNKSALERMVSALNCDYSPEGLIEFLVMVRGDLHHFSQRSTRPKGHPLNQMQWRAVAFFAMSVCLSIIKVLATGIPPDSV